MLDPVTGRRVVRVVRVAGEQCTRDGNCARIDRASGDATIVTASAENRVQPLGRGGSSKRIEERTGGCRVKEAPNE